MAEVPPKRGSPFQKGHMRSRDQRAQDEGRQGDHHARAAAAHGEEGPRPTAASQLHPEAEGCRPDGGGNAEREDEASGRQSKGTPIADQRVGNQDDGGDQQELRA